MGQLAIPKRGYETIYVLKPDTAKEAAEGLATRISDAVKTTGRMTRVENWGRRRLAYVVNNNKRGIYVYVAYEADGEVVSEVERALRLHESVMKFQTVKLAGAPSAGEVAPEDIQFQHVEHADDESDETYAESLGLEARSRWGGPPDHDAADDDDLPEDDVEGGAGGGEESA